MRTQITARWDRIVLGVSAALAVLAVTVIAGWHAHLPAAVQVFAGLVPMHYNTALGFLALAAAGFGLATHHRWWVAAGGLLAALMGGIVIFEYATGFSCGIDTLFFYPWVRSLSADPGRMALTTALSFSLTGVALVCLALRPAALGFFGIVNSVTLSLALTSLLGYAFQVTYVLPFSQGTQMALHTSAAFLAFGLVMLGHAWIHAERGPDGLPRWSAATSVALLPVLLVGANAIYPESSWPAVVLESLLAIAGVVLLALALRGLATGKVAYKGLLMIAIPLCLLLVFAGLVLRVKQQSRSTQVLAQHSAEVLAVAQSILQQITEVESSVRGYLITHDESFARGVPASLAAVASSTARLRESVSDNPVQLAGAERIADASLRRMDYFSQVVEVIRKGDPFQLALLNQSRNGVELMKVVQAEIASFVLEEERVGAERRRRLDASWQRLSWLLVAGTAAALLLACILTLSFSGGINRRLQRLRDNALSLAAGQALAPPLTGTDEIAELDRVFHAMAQSLEAANQRDQANRLLESHTIDVRHSEALLKTGALQSAIFNSANFSSIATDAKGVIQIFNVGAERMLGYTAAEVMNKITPADISDPQELIVRATALSTEAGTPIAPGFEALVFKASRGIEDIYELTYIRKDGSRFAAVVSVTALRDASGLIIGYLLIGTDNTARKQVEEERKKLDQRLRDQQFYTRSLIESNIDAIMTTDPLGIITDVNKQMEALTGCSRDELIGAPFKGCFTDPERAESAITLVLSEKKVTNYELTARARDGTETVVSYNATTFYDRDRRLQGVFAAARDITERKRVEHALQETNFALEGAKFVAEKANLAKSDFLSSMSHELRSPLNAILGFAQLMEATNPPPTPSQAARIAQILQAGWHLLKLINEILDLAVIESGQVSLSKEAVSLAVIMDECRSMMEPQAQARHIRMAFPRFDHPIFVRADLTRLKQIVINLLSNAIKYNRESGTVIVDCRMVAPDRIRISVKDTGYGLSPGKVAQLFQPFNRLGQENGSIAGTGIGLVVTKRLAELMDGKLGVECVVGEGCLFWCDLTSAAAPQLKEPAPGAGTGIQPLLPAGANARTLLYIEDNPANMELIEQLMAQWCPDIRMITAVNATLGLELARAFQPTLILMDINLPGISGLSALKILRNDPATTHIPVVALSANAMARDIAKGMDAGFFRYLTKPIKVQDFMETLNATLEFAEQPAPPGL
jgi:PAS domain S-box-containing protein